MTTINGTDQNDILASTVRADSLIGGLGDDVYLVEHAEVAVIEDSTLFNPSVGQVLLLSQSAARAPARGGSFTPYFTQDGQSVVFLSRAENLVTFDNNASRDVFIKNIATGDVTRLSTTSLGQQANRGVSAFSMSADGQTLAFLSVSTNLAADGISNAVNEFDVFVKDLQTGRVTRVSTDGLGGKADDVSFSPVISADGSRVAFASLAGNLVEGDSNGVMDIFVKNLASGDLTRINTNGQGDQADQGSYDRVAFSSDGSKIVFASSASNLVDGDTNEKIDIFVKDLNTGLIERVNTSATGEQANADSHSFSLSGAAFSPNGEWLAFSSRATNLAVGVVAGVENLFAKNLVTGELIQINLDQDGQPFAQLSSSATFSPDGLRVAFVATPITLTEDQPQVRQIYLKDLVTGALIQVSSNERGALGNAASDSYYAPQFSPDGLSIVFSSTATNLVEGDVNGFADVFIKQLTGSPSSLAGGLDTVQASVSFILPDNVEDLVLLGSQALQGDGNASDNQIFGNEGNNSLVGHHGDDSLYGGDGDDVLLGGEGHDSLYGGAGDDRLKGEEGHDTLYGVLGHDRLQGGAGDDVIYGGEGDDELSGSLGRDIIYGGDGQDSLLGGSGDDALYGDHGDDVLVGASGIDLLFGGDGQNQLYGGTGADYLAGDGGEDTLHGDSGMDVLEAGDGHDLLYGGVGTDQLYGGDGDDLLEGGTGFDTLVGGAGSDAYMMARGYRTDRIFEDHDIGNLDKIIFAEDIAADQLWFSRDGQSLVVSVIGTKDDRMIVEDWYTGASHRIEEFHSGDGLMLTDIQVQNLVIAMSGMTPPPAGQVSLDSIQSQQLSNVLGLWT